MYEFLGLCLALATLLACNSLASLGTSLLWRALAARVDEWPAAARARLLFTLRSLPAVLALLVVLFILAPAYAANEPRHGVEPVSFKLAALALLSAAGLLLACWRGTAAWLATRRLLRDWLQQAEPLAQSAFGVHIYRLAHPFPVLALVGVWRPRLFIADKLLNTLSPAELQAALAHEAGHLAARDNAKRALLRACRDVLTLVPCGRALDLAWHDAAEEAADEFAARRSQSSALDLASALVKIARLAEPQMRPTMLVSVSFIGYEPGILVRRVTRLTHLAEAGTTSTERLTRGVATLQWGALGALACLALVAASNPAILAAAHGALEFFVRSLQ
ncbi:MAG: M48 family metalloprotease [Acidobacteria bacterium]|nr:M48 family metalloprotease [Acidobacteriota bacterium]MBI3426631.1 M48 family metalloprotease [Acidobacteriota bacterium]